MRVTFFLILTTVGVVVVADDHYPNTFDRINIRMILRNDRVMSRNLACLLNKGPCAKEMIPLKNGIPEAIATKCAKCSEKQKDIIRQIGQYVNEKNQDIWQDFMQIYDPRGEHDESFKEFIYEKAYN